MDSSSEEVLGRIEKTMNAWDQQITDAEESVSQRLDKISERIGALRESWREKAESSTGEAVEVLNQQLEEARGNIAALQEENAALETAAETAQDEKALLENALAEARDLAEKQSQEREDLRRQVTDLSNENALLRREKGDAEKLRELLDQALANCDAAHDEIERLKGELNKAVSEASLTMPVPAPAPVSAPPPTPVPVADVDLSKVDTADARGRKRRFGDILVDAGILSQQQLEELLSQQGTGPRRRLGELVVESGYSTEDVIARVLAAQLGFEWIELETGEIDPIAPMMVTAQVARQHQCIPIRIEGDQLMVAMANPLDLIAIDDVELASSHPVLPAVATPAKIHEAITYFYGL